MKTKEKTRNMGSVLILVMIVVLVAMALGTGMITLGTQQRLAAIRSADDIRARAAADAGLELAVRQINNVVETTFWLPMVQPDYEDVPLEGSNATFSVNTSWIASEGYHIESVGTCNDRQRTVRSMLRLRGLFEEAILCRQSLTLKGGTVVDCIDSRISLDPLDTAEKVVIGTNSKNDNMVVLNNGVIVDGDIVVGVGGDVNTVIKDQGAKTGDRYALPKEIELPTVSPPRLWGPDSQISVNNGIKTIGFGGEYPPIGRYSSINLKQGTRLRVVGPCVLYVTGNVNMGQSSEIYLDPSHNASLKIYVNGSWVSDNNSGINNATLEPGRFELYATGGANQQIDLKAKSDFYGAIYAPDANVTVFSGGDLYGSFAAKTFELKNPANFFYDVALRDVNVSDEGAQFVVSRWTEN